VDGAQWSAAGKGLGVGAILGLLVALAYGTSDFVGATGAGQLAVVAVLAAFYPAVILLARGLLGECWTRPQALGLIAAGIAVGLISAG